MRSIKVLFLLVLTAVGLVGWRHLTAPPPLWTERDAELEALILADTITADAASWKEWSSRAFVPALVLDAIGDQFVGAKYAMPMGGSSNDGTFQLTLESFDLTGGDAWLEGRVGIGIRYGPGRLHQEWADTVARVIVRALILPRGRVADTFYVRVVPIAIAPQVSWRKWTLETAERALVAEALAAGVVQAFADHLVLPIVLPESPVLSTKFSSRSNLAFGGGGSTNIIVDYPGETATLALPFDFALASPKGLWLIARKQGAPALVAPLPAKGEATAEEVEALRRRISTRFAEWDAGANTTIAVSPATLQGVLKQLLPPAAPKDISIRTENSDGAIGSIKNVRSEFVDNASAELRPASNAFASGTLTMGAVSFALGDRALRLSIPVSITAKAALDLHLNPTLRIGSGIGAAFDANGVSEASLVATFSGEHKALKEGQAVVLQPLLSCQRVQMDITSDLSLGLEKHKVGVRLQQHVGGDPMEPAVLLDDVPLFAPYPPTDIGSTAVLQWPAARLVIQFTPVEAVLGLSGLSVSTAVTLGRDAEPADSSAFKTRLANLEKQRADLRQALKDAAPTSRCNDPAEVALLADGFEIGPNGDGVLFVRKMIALAGEVNADMMAQTERWLKDLADPTKPPQPAPDLGQAVLNRIASSAGDEARRFGIAPPPVPPPVPPPAPTGNPVQDVSNILSWRPW